MKLSVIIVSYNVQIHLQQCLKSVLKAIKYIDAEVIVVDNNSTDNTLVKLKPIFPSVKFIESESNLGFAKANNLAVSKAKGEYVFILNPDTVLPEDFFYQVLSFADSVDDLGALGVRMVNANGKFHPESKRNVPTPQNTFNKLFGHFIRSKNQVNYYKTDVEETDIAPVEILAGACMLLKREVYQKVGGFDETYFMYGEDIDLSYTLLQNGYTNWYKGDVCMLHYKGESTRKDKTFLRNFYKAMAIFMKKYYKGQNWLIYIMMRLGLKFRHWITLYEFSIKNPENNFETCLQTEIKPWNENNPSNCVLLNGNEFSNSKILQIMTDYRTDGKRFFIQPEGMNVWIGDKTVIEL